jgi:hypothetical protein
MLDAPAVLSRLAEPWSKAYSDSKLLPTVVTFAHVAALLFAGGLAVTLDRATLRAAPGSADVRARQIDDLSAAHRFVLWGLGLSLLSGVLLFASDLDTFWTSWIWWTKATMIVLLLVNGGMMTRAEAQVRANPAESEPGWGRLRTTAIVSTILWFAITLAGVALVSAE